MLYSSRERLYIALVTLGLGEQFIGLPIETDVNIAPVIREAPATSVAVARTPMSGSRA